MRSSSDLQPGLRRSSCSDKHTLTRAMDHTHFSQKSQPTHNSRSPVDPRNSLAPPPAPSSSLSLAMTEEIKRDVDDIKDIGSQVKLQMKKHSRNSHRKAQKKMGQRTQQQPATRAEDQASERLALSVADFHRLLLRSLCCFSRSRRSFVHADRRSPREREGSRHAA